jgi:hypothetical protein
VRRRETRHSSKLAVFAVKKSVAVSKIDVLEEYFRQVDAGSFPAHLFTPGFQFYFATYGVGFGPAAFAEMAQAMGSTAIARVKHHISDFLFIEEGNRVAVEGTTEGTGRNDVNWHGGQTPGGRFCSIFVFNDVGLIERMHIYLDPDYTGAHKDKFVCTDRPFPRW